MDSGAVESVDREEGMGQMIGRGVRPCARSEGGRGRGRREGREKRSTGYRCHGYITQLLQNQRKSKSEKGRERERRGGEMSSDYCQEPEKNDCMYETMMSMEMWGCM